MIGALAVGALAGAVATIFMSVLMLAAGRAGLMGMQPPEAITERVLGWRSRLPWREDESNLAASVAHVGFGAVAGAVFGLARRFVPGATLPGAGILYGLGVWATAYLGWVPALGILPPATEDRPGRPASMIAAHVVYGAVLGALMRGVRRTTRA